MRLRITVKEDEQASLELLLRVPEYEKELTIESVEKLEDKVQLAVSIEPNLFRDM